MTVIASESSPHVPVIRKTAGEREAQGRNNAPISAWQPNEAATYIADLTAELAGVARAAKLDLVAYLLDIAGMEASRAGQRLSSDRT